MCDSEDLIEEMLMPRILIPFTSVKLFGSLIFAARVTQTQAQSTGKARLRSPAETVREGWSWDAKS